MHAKTIKYTAQAIVSEQRVAMGEFPNGFTAIVFKRGRTVFAKLYDRNGKEVGDQYGDSKCPFFTHWTFPHEGVTYEFEVIQRYQ